ncbi:MAG: hypothetical protein WC136_01365 [Sphaerochaeta sp.]|jgi:hypothetical protein
MKKIVLLVMIASSVFGLTTKQFHLKNNGYNGFLDDKTILYIDKDVKVGTTVDANHIGKVLCNDPQLFVLINEGLTITMIYIFEDDSVLSILINDCKLNK